MRLKVPFLRYALGVVAFLLPTAVLAAILPFLINAQPVRAKLMREIGSWTGGEVKTAGAISVRDFFSLTVEASDVEIGRFKGIAPIEGMKAQRITARIAWFNLLLGSFDFDKIKFYGAHFRLRGKVGDMPALLADLITGPSSKPFAALSFDDTHIAVRTGPRKPYRRVLIDNAHIRSAKSGRQLNASARFTWKGRSVTVAMRSAFRTPRGAPLPLRLQVSSDLLEGRFEGEAMLRGTPEAEGDIRLSTTDITAAADWLGMEASPAFATSAAVSGQIAFGDDLITLASGEVSLAGQTAQTALTLKRGAALPRLEGSLAFGALDLKSLLGGQGRIDRLTDGSAIQTALATDLRLSAKSLRWGDLEAGSAALALTSQPKRLAAEIAELDFASGEVRGHIALDTDGVETRASARLSADNLDAATLLRLTRQRDWLIGAADVNLEAEATWVNPDEMLDKLSGKARVNFPEGGQMGLDLPRLAASTTGESDGWGSFDFTTAAFEKLRFELMLREGQLNFANVLLASAGGHANGRGEIDLAERSLDWRFTFDPAGAPHRPGAAMAQADKPLGAQLSIRGPWERPIIRSDAGFDNSMLAAPGHAAANELTTPAR